MPDRTNEIYVEWDENKDRLNREKHGICFETAALVFSDDKRITFYDVLHSMEEDRYVTIGKVGRILVVVFTERAGCYRIISARLAVKEERRLYYGYRS